MDYRKGNKSRLRLSARRRKRKNFPSTKKNLQLSNGNCLETNILPLASQIECSSSTSNLSSDNQNQLVLVKEERHDAVPEQNGFHKESNTQMCSLCRLEMEHCEKMEGLKIDMLEVIAPEWGPDVCSKSWACQSCCEMVTTLFNRKSIWLENDDSLFNYVKFNNGKIDLKFVLVPTKMHEFADCLVCRLCLKMSNPKNGYFKCGDISSIMKKTVPEVDISVSADPVICTECLETINSMLAIVQCKKPTTSSVNEEVAHNNLSTLNEGIHNNFSTVNATVDNNFSALNDELVKNNSSPQPKKAKIELKIAQCITQIDSQIIVQQPPISIDSKHPSTSSVSEVPAIIIEEKPASYCCIQCQFSTKYLWVYQSHIAGHEQEQLVSKSAVVKKEYYVCKTCSKRTYSRKEAMKHLKIHKNELKCDLCDNKGARDSANVKLLYHIFTDHFTTESREIYKCTKCSYTGNSAVFLQSHIQREHVDDAKFLCDQCNCQYPTKIDLDVHVCKPTNGYFLTCSSCSFKTKSVAGMKKHRIRKHSPKPYVCKLCGNRFAIKTDIVAHIRGVHKREVKAETLPDSICDSKTEEADNQSNNAEN